MGEPGIDEAADGGGSPSFRRAALRAPATPPSTARRGPAGQDTWDGASRASRGLGWWLTTELNGRTCFRGFVRDDVRTTSTLSSLLAPTMFPQPARPAH